MAHRTFTINSAEDWKRCAAWVSLYTKDLEKKMGETVKEIATIGADEAMARYAANTDDKYAYANVRSIDATTANVEASGWQMYFNEFGAGVSTDTNHPYRKSASVPIKVGSYSDPRHGPFARSGHKEWEFKGKTYTGIPASRGLYHAMQKMRAESVNICRRIFGRQ